ILEKLKNKENIKEYDYIILPGLVYGDATEIEEKLKVKVVKGTEEAYDLPLVIDALIKGVELSKTDPADKILGKLKSMKISEKLLRIERSAKYAFEVNGLKIPLVPPPFRIFLELDYKWDQDRIIEEAKRVKKYVDVIVASFPVGHNDVDEVKRKIKILIDQGFNVGIDSESSKEIIEGVRSGASFVFNLNEENIEKLLEIKNDAAFILAPYNPEKSDELIQKIYERARGLGYEKIIVDPILSPPLKGLTNSILQYLRLRKIIRDAPFMMGALNVTELIDADSIGINSLIVTIAGEIGVSNILTMEKGKTRWSSWEIKKAAEMISIAIFENKFPKDLGVDLLYLKDKGKRMKESEIDINGNVEYVNNYVPPSMDKGFVKIFLKDKKICIKWFGKDELTVIGNDALSVGRTLIRRVGDISREHALYIGYELAKAEIALKLDKEYVQDRPLFKSREEFDESSNT
ncbi:MAG: dihydropteroate synthase-like protein, partial [Sulfolobaceae archaeon]